MEADDRRGLGRLIPQGHNNGLDKDARKMRPRTCQPDIVCQAWYRASEMKVLAPGISGAEGEEKGKDVVARRGLEEAQSESTGRRTGTGYEVWYIRDEPERDDEVLHPRIGCAI
jgi:hypothetical protein